MFVRALILALVASTAACAATPTEDDGSSVARDQALSPSCDLVKCALPLCTESQHLEYRGSCCPQCVDNKPTSAKCATVLCLAVACPEGEQLVTSPGDCCGHCQKAKPVAECTTDSDCPQYYCIQCPCPYSQCIGRKCVTKTPDASTCGGTQ
jgi:hypothetical protein